MAQAFPVHDLLALIKCQEEYEYDGVGYVFVETKNTNEVADGTDNLGEWNYIIFQVRGVTYRAWYVDGSRYWYAESGDAWDDKIPRKPKYGGREHQNRYGLSEDGQSVLCEEVRKKEVVTYTWETV